jgi:hypothetical protein
MGTMTVTMTITMNTNTMTKTKTKTKNVLGGRGIRRLASGIRAGGGGWYDEIVVRKASIVAVLVLAGALGCGSDVPRAGPGAVAPRPRRTVVWLDARGVDAATAERLRLAGVDELVVERGTVNLAGEVPVFRMAPAPTVAGSIPVALALRVEAVRENLGEGMASAVWRAIAAELGESTPVEILLDLPAVSSGLGDFVGALSNISGVPVIPVLTPQQLRLPEAVHAVSVARSCVVPIAGTGHPSLRGVAELPTLTIAEKLEPLASIGVRVRLAVGLHPVTEPALAEWGDDINPLTEPEIAAVSTSSILDRTFEIKRSLNWSGRQWSAEESVAVRWLDASRLHTSLAEAGRLILPEVAGWDLVPLPPEEGGLGLSREALIRYLEGEGPNPEVTVKLETSGTRFTVSLDNPGPFGSAVSGVGNWLEVSIVSGSLVADSRGSFDRLVLGSVEGNQWNPRYLGAPSAARYSEIYVAPGEQLNTGPVRLSSRRAQVRVRWQLLLSSGEVRTGSLAR